MDIPSKFKNREQAGHFLARKLSRYKDKRDVVIMAIPRCGIMVGYPIARDLNAPLLCLMNPRLGIPSQSEAERGETRINGATGYDDRNIVGRLWMPTDDIADLFQDELDFLTRQERIYKGIEINPWVENKLVIVVDDGITTGNTMSHAIQLLEQYKPAKIVIAVPVVPPMFSGDYFINDHEFITIKVPDIFYSIASWYEDFSHEFNDEIKEITKEVEDFIQ
ncbi:hypothetical protein GF325_13055 [Candidatus Bathyarchaeota archaeon]|nr:hypothetical protein [Candidatus Bathyarchaeota archaeon]